MQSAFIINDKTGSPYAVIGVLNGGTQFYPIVENARTWSGWMQDEFAARKITREELVATLDNSMQIEGPLSMSRGNKLKVEELLKKAKKPSQVALIESAKQMTEKSENLPVISLIDAHISDLEDTDWKNVVNFKAKSFIADANKSTFAYEVKRTRAVWDPSLSVPGTERRGGWRCPVGTRYGGQITDRFGRNCGWGVARRLANEISDLGERLENVGDRRMARRVERRNARMVRRLEGGAGRIERAARGVANALESDRKPQAREIQAPKEPRGAGLVERIAGRVAQGLETRTPQQRRQRRGVNAPDRQRQDRAGALERIAGRVADVLQTEEENVPSRRQAPRRRPPAPRAPQARPARPRQPRQPRQPRPIDNVSGTPVPAGAPNPGEALDVYKRRKYDEHQANVRRIREQGGNAGFLRYEEWDRFHGPAVEENWRRANPSPPNQPAAPAPQAQPRAPRAPRAPRQPAGRPARRAATTGNAGRAATRRPTANDVPEANQPPARRPRRPRRPREAALPDVNNGGSQTVARPVNKAMDRHDTAMPRLGDENNRIRRVQVGNAGINSKQDAVAFRGSINDVPDDFLQDALGARSVNGRDTTTPSGRQIPPDFHSRAKQARTNPDALTDDDKEILKEMRRNGKDFYVMGGASITAPKIYLRINEDGGIDGRGYILKPQDPDARGRGQHSELVGIEIARRMGFAQGAPRVIERNGSAAFLMELGPNLAEGHAVDFRRDQVTDERSRLGHYVVNMLVGAGDRHPRNGMHFVGDGALPIDFGRAFFDQSPATPQNMAGYSFGMLDRDPLGNYKKLLQQGKTEQEIKQQIKRDLAEWKQKVQTMFDDGTYDSFVGMIPNWQDGLGNFMGVSRRKALLQSRIDLLDSDEFIDLMWQRRP